jgi:hypothetical protein
LTGGDVCGGLHIQVMLPECAAILGLVAAVCCSGWMQQAGSGDGCLQPKQVATAAFTCVRYAVHASACCVSEQMFRLLLQIMLLVHVAPVWSYHPYLLLSGSISWWLLQVHRVSWACAVACLHGIHSFFMQGMLCAFRLQILSMHTPRLVTTCKQKLLQVGAVMYASPQRLRRAILGCLQHRLQ